MSIVSSLFEILANVIFEPASLASSLSKRLQRSKLPDDCCVHCKSQRLGTKEENGWIYYCCRGCGETWVVPLSGKLNEKLRRVKRNRVKKSPNMS